MSNEMENSVYYIPNTNAPVNVPYKTYKRKPSIKITKKDFIFSLLFAVISFVIVDFILFHGFNLGATISYFILFAVSTLYLARKGNKVSVFSVVCGVLSLAGAVTLTLYSDKLIKFFMLFLICALFAIYVCGLSATFRNKQGSFKMLCDLVCSAFVSPFKNCSEIAYSFKGSYSKSRQLKSTLIGLAVSVPALLVIIPLLSNSDAAFNGLVTIIITNIGIYLLEIAIALVVALYLILYFIAKNKNLPTGAEGAGRLFAQKGCISSNGVCSFLAAISVTYIVYLFSQLAYFFSAFSGILPKGYEFTESAYARRGFFEMFAICIINVVIISLATMLTKRNKKSGIPLAVKLFSVFIMMFTVLLLITAVAKMKMCLNIFGLSKNRMLVCTFMLMLFVMIAFYIIHIFAPKVSYMQCIIVVCSVLFIALSYSNVNKTVASYNIDAYNNGKIASLDVEYMGELSDEAVPYLIELAKSDDSVVAYKAKVQIINSIRKNYGREFKKAYINNEDLKASEDNDFREYNASASSVRSTVADYYNSLSLKDRELLYAEYLLDDCDYCYDSDTDSYEVSTGKSIYHFKYNEKSDVYELISQK